MSLFHNYLKPAKPIQHIVENGLTQLYVVVAQRKDCIMKLINIANFHFKFLLKKMARLLKQR